MEPTTVTTARSQNIHIRVAPQQRMLIDQAAQAAGKTRSEFILDAATQAAENALLDQRLFALNAAQWDAFLQMLDAPAQPNAALAQLMATRPPWE
ncbi:MAG: DUF1778 domain-containing protein [Caldilineaceae bacterium]